MRVGDTGRALGGGQHANGRGVASGVLDLGVDDVDGQHDPPLADRAGERVVGQHILAGPLRHVDHVRGIETPDQERACLARGR